MPLSFLFSFYATFFSYSLKRILAIFFLFILKFLGLNSRIWEKIVFCLVARGFTIPTPLVVRPLKKMFMCVFPKCFQGFQLWTLYYFKELPSFIKIHTYLQCHTQCSTCKHRSRCFFLWIAHLPHYLFLFIANLNILDNICICWNIPPCSIYFLSRTIHPILIVKNNNFFCLIIYVVLLCIVNKRKWASLFVFLFSSDKSWLSTKQSLL